MGIRTIVVGDVHGCLEELDELIRVVELRPGFDRLVFVGDLLDRGPDPLGCLRRARELHAECVVGNHEDKHLRWARHEALRRSDPTHRNPLRPFGPERMAQHARLGPDDLTWLSALPHVLRLDGRWGVVHGGLSPRRRFDHQLRDEVIRMRLVDGAGHVAAAPRGELPPGLAHWATRWPGPESVAYGHHVHGLEVPRVDEPAPGVRCVGLDTGCVYGGRLSALVLPAEEIVSVTARQAYAARRRPA
ncbi:MAG TPA: metallophosphoesterase [Anaeromyxobacteraceae bacterium]|nr:metallophosphoesterase [Anaeromyxobacteraceae bacterium]